MTSSTALIIQTAFLGDVVLATPLVEHLHTSGYTVDVLVRKGNESLLTDHPKIREILIWDKRRAKFANLLKLSRIVRGKKYHMVINCHRHASSGLVTLASSAQWTSGFRQNPLSIFFSNAVEHRFGDGTHETQRNLSLLPEKLKIERLKPKLYPSQADYQKVIRNKPYVTLSPASVWYTKRLPKKQWLTLIEKLPLEVEIHLLGGPGDKQLCTEIAQESSRQLIIQAGELSLLQSAALMKGAQMNYVNDSGPLHLASAMDAATTAFFLNTVPSFGFGPLATSSTILETKEKLSCRPCGMTGKSSCPAGHFKCSAIDIEI